MEIKTLKPTTSSQRHVIKINNKYLNKKPILKLNIKGLKISSGRNNSGKITSRHKGGGHKKKYRKIDFCRKQYNNTTGIVMSIEYDPNRNAHIASVYEIKKKIYFYILAPLGLSVGDIIKNIIKNNKKLLEKKENEKTKELKLGYFSSLEKISEKLAIHNITLRANQPAKITRSAGTFSYILDKFLNYCLIELSSGKQVLVPLKCYATIGIVSNEFYILSEIGKAGRARWLNKRPFVRGTAMNPVDHPNGGGEGKKSGKGYITPWGKQKKTKKSFTTLIKI